MANGKWRMAKEGMAEWGVFQKAFFDAIEVIKNLTETMTHVIVLKSTYVTIQNPKSKI